MTALVRLLRQVQGDEGFEKMRKGSRSVKTSAPTKDDALAASAHAFASVVSHGRGRGRHRSARAPFMASSETRRCPL